MTEHRIRYAYIHLNDEWIIVTHSDDEYDVWNKIPHLQSFVSLRAAKEYRRVYLKE